MNFVNILRFEYFFKTIVKTHNKKTIDHAKFHTKPQKW